MSDTIAADVLDALYDLLAAQPNIASAIANGQLRLVDGPVVGDISTETLFTVGAWPVVADEDAETTVSFDWSSMGVSGAHADVDQNIEVPCGISCLSGNADGVRAARRLAIGYYAEAATAIRGSTLGLGPVMWCTPGVGSIKQIQTDRGVEVVVTFAARVRTRI